MTALPTAWAQATVGEIAELTDGPFGSNLKTAHYTEAGPRVVRLQNIGDGAFRDEHAHIAQEHYERLIKHAVRPGDIVVASLGEEAPRACLVPPWLGPAVVKADCIRARTLDGIDSALLMWMLNSPSVRAQAASSIKGVGRPRLGLGGLKRLAVPVPPLNEQRRILAAIEEQFSRLDAAEESIKGARRKLDVLRTRAVEAAFSDDWPWTSLGAVAEIVGGVTKDLKRQGDPSFVEVPYLRVANVQRGFLDLTEISTIRVPPDKAKALELRAGDVLFNEGGDRDKLGRGWVWSGEIERCIHQNHVFRARLRDGFEPKFVSWHGNTFGRRWFEEHGRQTTNLASLNLTTLKSFPVPAPPAEEQRRVVAEVERQLSIVDAMATEIDHALRRSAALRRSILEQAFSGKLVPQDPSDEPASVLLERIAASRAAAPKPARRKRKIRA